MTSKSTTKDSLLARTKYMQQKSNFIKKFSKMNWQPETVSDEDEYAVELVKIVIVAAAGMIPIVGPVAAPITESIYSFFTMNAERLEKDYKTVVQELVDQKIAIYDASVLVKQYDAYMEIYKKFDTALKIFNKNGVDPTHDVSGYWRSLDDFLTKSINDAKKDDLAVQELHMYTLFVTMRLILLRDKYINGLKWGWLQDSVNATIDDMNKLISDATTWCKSTYTKGLALITKNRGYTDQLLSCELDYFNDLNTYRNHMIYMIFDFVAVWPTYVPDQYPNYASTERVRYLFSDICGIPIDPNMADPTNSSYYKITADRIAQLLAPKEAYQGALEKISLWKQPSTYNSRFTGVSCSIRDCTGTLNTVSSGESYQMTETDGTIDKAAHVVNLEYDIVPRSLTIDSGIIDVQASDVDQQKDKGQSKEWNYYYQFGVDNNTIFTKDDHRNKIGYDYVDHKPAQLFTLGTTNREVKVPSGISDYKYGYLGNLCMAFSADGTFPENVVFPNTITMIDTQKYLYTAGATFVRDAMMPGVHGMSLTNTQWLSYYLQRSKKAQKNKYFKIGLQLTATTPYSLKISFGTENGTLSFFTIKGTNATEPIPVIKNAIIQKGDAKTSQLRLAKVKTDNYLKIEVDSGTVTLFNIVITPTVYN